MYNKLQKKIITAKHGWHTKLQEILLLKLKKEAISNKQSMHQPARNNSGRQHNHHKTNKTYS